MGMPNFEPLIVPVIFTLSDRSCQLRLAATRAIPVNSIAAMRATQNSSDPAAWIAELIAQELPELHLTSRVHPLLPRLMGGNRVAMPVWAAARSSGTDSITDGSESERVLYRKSSRQEADQDLAYGLERLGRELGDRSFGRHVMSSMRAELTTDPFAQRILGDDLRLSALSGDQLTQNPTDGLPAVIALLPESFTFNELQNAIAATLGLEPDAMESNSSFRRRSQEFVHRGVLREVRTSRDPSEADRIGRPPRRYEFDQHAWRIWLEERGGTVSMRSAQRTPVRFSPPMSPMTLHMRAPLREERANDVRASEDDSARRDIDPGSAQESTDSRGLPSWLASPRRSIARASMPSETTKAQVEPEPDRLARLERMVEMLAQELARSKDAGRGKKT
ncbi:MAG: hypothetical protein RIR77_2085 [Planctomycetota bacterium]|jgi:hypothetical protein